MLALGEPGHHGFDDRGGLARAGTGQDQQRTVTVLHDLALLVIQAGLGGRRYGRQVQLHAHNPWIPPRCDTIDR